MEGKLFRFTWGYVCMNSRTVVENVSGEGSARDIVDLRKRVVRLEVQVADLAKRVESLSNYSCQLFDYLNNASR